MSKHTPGPWVMQCNHLDILRIYAPGPGRVICKLPKRSDGTYEEISANGELISEAPTLKAENERLKEINTDMLHELERLTELVGEVDYDILMAVIAKAKDDNEILLRRMR